MKHSLSIGELDISDMPLLCLFVFSMLYLTPATGQAQKAENPQFEGVIQYEIPAEVTSKLSSRALTYMARGNEGRVEFQMENGRKMSVLVDSKQQKVTMLMDQAQSYMEFPLDKVGEEGKQSQRGQPELQKTRRTDRVAGKNCQIWRVEDEGKTIDMCIANGMGNFLLPGTEIPVSMGPLKIKKRPEWFQEAMQRGFMPLKVTVDENGNKRTVLIAKSIQEKSLPSSLFSVPSDYQNMNQMMRQMMQQEKNN